MNALALSCLLLAAIARAPVQAAPSTSSAQAIIEKHINAIGGRHALRAVRTLMIRGRNAGLGAADRPIVRYLKQPHWLRQQEAPGATSFILADGRKVYQVTSSGSAEFTQPWAKTLLHTTIDGDFLDPARPGIRYEYLGTEGTATGPWRFHHIKRAFADGYVEDLYFEVESGLLRIVVEDNGRAKRVYYEYRAAGGILYPRLWATVFDNREPPHVFIVDEVQVNPPLDDAIFSVGGQPPSR